MLFIWGFRTLYKKLGEGMFFCQRCGGDRTYVHRIGRRWFTFYFIPLFPTGKTGNEHVQCQTCKQAFTMNALTRPTSTQLSGQLTDAVRALSVHILRAGSMQVPAVRECAVLEVQRTGLTAYDDNALAADLDVVPGDVSALYSELGRRLEPAGKEKMVLSAVRIAAADGPVNSLEMTVIKHLGAALGLTAMHIEGICARAGQAVSG